MGTQYRIDRNIALIGPPGSGKSTLGKVIASTYDMVYVSTGDIARKMAESDIDTKDNLANGMLAPEQKMRDALYCTLYDIVYHGKAFVLDGFPRFDDQYLWLMKKFHNIDYYLVDVPIDECRKRLLSRHRGDDVAELIDRRIEYYNKNTQPMISMIGLVKRVRNEAVDTAVSKVVGFSIEGSVYRQI